MATPTVPTELETAFKIIGDKWTGIILYTLKNGARRFSEISHCACGINPRTLSQRLDTMEENKLLTKQVFAELPPRTEYTLTQKGLDLCQALRPMMRWADNYYPGTVSPDCD